MDATIPVAVASSDHATERLMTDTIPDTDDRVEDSPEALPLDRVASRRGARMVDVRRLS